VYWKQPRMVSSPTTVIAGESCTGRVRRYRQWRLRVAVRRKPDSEFNSDSGADTDPRSESDPDRRPTQRETDSGPLDWP